MTNFEKYCSTPWGLVAAISKHSDQTTLIRHGDTLATRKEIDLNAFADWMDEEAKPTADEVINIICGKVRWFRNKENTPADKLRVMVSRDVYELLHEKCTATTSFVTDKSMIFGIEVLVCDGTQIVVVGEKEDL